MSQKLEILRYLKEVGPITRMDSLDMFKAVCLPERIRDLRRDGHIIEKRMITVPSGKRVAEYFLPNNTSRES